LNNDETPTGGTINAVYETTPDPDNFEIWSYSNGNVDVLQFLSHLGTGDFLIFLSILLTGHDLIIGAEGPDHLYGFGGNDTIFGGAGNDRLFGMGGNNRLNGGPGNDQLHGGPGNNTLTGGAGADRFWFDTALNTGVDKITDFTLSQHDKIVLSKADFPRLGPHGKLAAAHFHVNHSGPGASPEIVYTPGNGFLYYDANGHLPGGMTHFATLSTHPVIHNTDFLLIA
jgi:Ca2+-binding RTX toxin-like protein